MQNVFEIYIYKNIQNVALSEVRIAFAMKDARLLFIMKDVTCVCNGRYELRLQWKMGFAFAMKHLICVCNRRVKTSVCNERCDLHLQLTTWFAFELEEIRPAFAMKDVKLAFAGKVWDFHNFR